MHHPLFVARAFLSAFAFAAGAATPGFGQITTYQFTGSIPQHFSSLAEFPEYSQFTVTIDVDFATPRTGFAANTAKWFGAVDLTFNFANGTYVGAADNLDLWMQGANAYVSLDRGATTVLNFPQVQGLSVSPTSILPYFSNFQDSDANFSGVPALSALNFQEFIGEYAYFKLNFGPGYGQSFSGTLDSVTTAIPEPSTYVFCFGLAGLTAVLLRRRYGNA